MREKSSVTSGSTRGSSHGSAELGVTRRPNSSLSSNDARASSKGPHSEAKKTASRTIDNVAAIASNRPPIPNKTRPPTAPKNLSKSVSSQSFVKRAPAVPANLVSSTSSGTTSFKAHDNVQRAQKKEEMQKARREEEEKKKKRMKIDAREKRAKMAKRIQEQQRLAAEEKRRKAEERRQKIEARLKEAREKKARKILEKKKERLKENRQIGAGRFAVSTKKKVNRSEPSSRSVVTKKKKKTDRLILGAKRVMKKSVKQDVPKKMCAENFFEDGASEDTTTREEPSSGDMQNKSKAKKATKGKKNVPEWARPQNLLNALKKQSGMLPGTKAIDPDKIFAPVTTCNLEEIFPSRVRKRFRKRYSTGNWSKDAASDAELFLYRKQMGYGKN